MKKYPGVPIEIHVMKRDERGKPWRKIQQGKAIPLERFLSDMENSGYGIEGKNG